MNELSSAIKSIRTASELCWEQAADEPRGERQASRLLGDWDNWGQMWDEAEEYIDDGDFSRAAKALEVCAIEEAAYGSYEHARAALTLVRAAAITP